MSRSRNGLGRTFGGVPLGLALGAVLVLGAFDSLAGEKQVDAAAARANDRLHAANASFRQIYAKNRTERLRRSGIVIVVQFGDLVLYKDGQEVRRETFTSPLYHALKTIAHIPLAVTVVYANALAMPDDPTLRPELERVYAEIAKLDEPLLAEHFPAEVLKRQVDVVKRSRTFVAQALKDEKPNRAALAAYIEGVNPPVMRNADLAARAQLDGLHALATSWRAELGPDTWEHMYVLVLGAKAPRRGNLEFEYFRRQMGAAAVGRRLVYVEGVFDLDGAMTSLGTLLQDRDAAQLFFGDRMRLDRDLLADAAKAYLSRLLGQ